MRKILILLSFALAALSCAKEELEAPESEQETAGHNAYLLASAGATKASISDDYVKLGWIQTDSLSVYTSKGRFVDFVFDRNEEKEGVARFKGVLDPGEKIDRFVVFPAGKHLVREGQLYVNYPDTYEYVEGDVRPLMLAEYESSDKVLEFRHLGGMFAFDVVGVPEGASSFEFTTKSSVKGLFPVEGNEVSTGQTQVANKVTLTFPALEQIEDMKFFVPVPTGDYPGFTVTISDGENTLLTKSSTKTNSIVRSNLKKFSLAASEIVYVTVNGAGAKTGSTWADATTLTSALENAKDGQVIRMAGGTYVPDKVLSGSADQSALRRTFLVNKHVSIQGSYKQGTSEIDTLATPTIISGQIADGTNAYHAIVVAAPGEGKTVLRGLVFEKGNPMTVNTDALVKASPTTTTSDGVAVLDYRGGGLYVGSDVSLRSCNFRDNKAVFHTNTSGTMGVGMYVAKSVTADVEDCTFMRNEGGACGGALYAHGISNLTDCLFRYNKASHGGAVHNAGRINVSGCVFQENEATAGFAGAFRQQGSTVTISKTSFIGNRAKTHGGAVQNNRNTIFFSDCCFDGNVANGDGGAVANWGGGKMDMNNCTFTGNTATQGGTIANMVSNIESGKTALDLDQSVLDLNKCVFVGDAADGENSAQRGGAIRNHASVLTVSGCSFCNFSADQEGGVIVNENLKELFPSLVLDKGCVFKANTAELGGALANLAGTVEISNCDFESNVAAEHGGALYNAFCVLKNEDGSPEGERTVMTVKSSEFISNTSGHNGGAVMNWYAEDFDGIDGGPAAPLLEITNSEFIGNKVTSKDAYLSQGGAIANQCSVLSVSGSHFSENFAAHGGAVYNYDYSATKTANGTTPLSDRIAYAYIYNTCFDSNSVDLSANSNAQGSDIRTHGVSRNLVVNSTFRGGNSPTGSIRLRTGATCYLVSCTFTENVSGPYNQGSVMKVYNTVSYGNTKQKYNYYANEKGSTDVFSNSLLGSMSLAERYETTGNYYYDEREKPSVPTISNGIFGAYRDGIYDVVGEPALSHGMTNDALSALAVSIRNDMPDIETKYFTRDQKDSPRSQEKVMGAYVGDVYLDPDRDGYLNGTELDEELNLRGLVKDNSGNPVAGVAVSDGYDVVTTDKNGVYQFAAHQDARLLSISIPAEYEIPYKNNKPDMWVRIDPTDYEIRNDFVLNRRSSAVSDFTIFSLADTHVASEAHYERFSTETMKDLARTVNRGSYDRNSFAVILGDIMFDNYTQVENVKTSLSGAPVPVFPCFGNHDCSSSQGTTELELISKYQEHFGPVDYSFNMGQVHFVFMKDMIYEGKTSYGKEGHYYAQGFLDHQVEWLKKDLAAVDGKENKMVILCVHIPLKGSSNGSKNYKTVVEELLKFGEVHVLSGHHHGVYNHISSDKTVKGKTFYDHNQIAAAGAWWRSNLNPDGSPNGYMIYNINGNTLKDHVLKGTNQALGYQMRVYDGGESYTAPQSDSEWGGYNSDVEASWSDNLSADLAGKFVVHVFNADVRDWKVYFVQNGKRTEMFRTTNNWYDVASYAYAGFYTGWASGGAARYSEKVKNTNFWYIDAPSGYPSQETGWRIEAEHTYDGRTVVYTADRIHTKYAGFAPEDFTSNTSLEDMTEVEYEFAL